MAKDASNKGQMKIRWKRLKGEKKTGPEEATSLPDHVIAEIRCQNAAEEEKSMHIRQRREDKGEAERQKRTKEGGRQERSV